MDLSGQEFGQRVVGMTCLLHVSSSAGQTQQLSVANWALGDLECFQMAWHIASENSRTRIGLEHL